MWACYQIKVWRYECNKRNIQGDLDKKGDLDKNRNPSNFSNGSKLHLDKPTGISLLSLSSCETGV